MILATLPLCDIAGSLRLHKGLNFSRLTKGYAGLEGFLKNFLTWKYLNYQLKYYINAESNLYMYGKYRRCQRLWYPTSDFRVIAKVLHTSILEV